MPLHNTLMAFCGLLFLLSTPHASAAGTWKISEKTDGLVAITPNHNMILKMRKPNKGLWGKLYIHLDAAQTINLKKFRLDKYFSFISVGVEIDRYTRNTNAKVEESKNVVRIDIDERMWEGLKKGSELTIYLPDGSTYTEKLRGSSNALRQLERNIFQQR